MVGESKEGRSCPICGSASDHAAPFLDQNIDQSKIVGSSFASRKVPEYMNHLMVRCLGCDLVYVPHAPGQDDLAESYHAADYDSSQEAEDAADSYIQAIGPLLSQLAGRTDAALEIGTGTAAFLERLGNAGFGSMIGIEPSIAAIAAAPANRKPWIKQGIFEPGLYPAESFDLIACFMTLEHVRDPGALFDAAHAMLRPGGAFVAVTHDYHAWVNRLLGRRSPIIDIEHMQLFSNASMRALYETRGLVDVECHSFRNAYRPSYWARLAPLPDAIKSVATRWIAATPLDEVRLPFNVGNMVSWGFKA
jgi:SAM-dependent methyltransferase